MFQADPARLIGRVIRRIKRSPIVYGFSIIIAANLARQLLQLVSLVIIARFLGTTQFGEFASIVAVVGIVAAFAGWGSDQLVVRTVAQDRRSFSQAVSSGLTFYGLSAPALIALCSVAIPTIFRSFTSITVVFPIALSDILFTRLNVFAGACYQARHEAKATASNNLSFSAVRLIAVGIWLLTVPRYSLTSWAWFYCLSSGIAGLLSIGRLLRKVDLTRWHVEWHEWKDGFLFSLQMASFSAFRDTDKPIVSYLSSPSTVGIYAAAFRISDAAAMPIRALMYATFPHFFRHAKTGQHHSLEFAIKILPAALVMGVAAGATLVGVAPLVPSIFGTTYLPARSLLVILAGLPLLYGLYYLAGDVLISTGYIWLRGCLQIAMPVLDIALCFALVPSYGAAGAAVATMLSHLSLAAASWIAVAIIVKSRVVQETPR
jgi:O-antigen/teichoic acid export membrane protein